MASKKRQPVNADRYENALQRAIQKALQLPEGNDKTVYRSDLAPLKPQLLKPSKRKMESNKYAPKNPFDPNVPPDVRKDYSAKNKKKKSKGMTA